MKVFALVAVPEGVVTRHLPSGSAIEGTLAVMDVGEFTVKTAGAL